VLGRISSLLLSPRRRGRERGAEQLEIDGIGHDFFGGSPRAFLIQSPPQLIESVRNIDEPAVEQVFLSLRRLGQRTQERRLAGRR
jgi:hypothetical protein